MKKYWKSTAVVICIVLSIGTFYVNSAMSAERYPEIAFQTISGDAEEVKSLVLDGSYIISSSTNREGTDLKITTEGSSYNSRSFLDQLTEYYPTVIKELQEEYRTFMRGKNLSVNQYFEDNGFLAYANVNQKISSLGSNKFTYDISVLNKVDDKTNSFKLEVPVEEGIEHIFIEDVQLIENKMHLITQNMVRNNSDFYVENHVYEIDINSQKLISHKTLFKFNQVRENIHTNIRIVESSPTTANEYIILLKTEEEMVEESESIRAKDTKQEIISYNLITKEEELVNVPGLSLDENQLSFVREDTIYFTRVEEQELIITPYRLGEKQTEQNYRIQLHGSIEKEALEPPLINVKEDKLYIVSRQIDSSSSGDIAVIDLQTRKPLFEGQVALKAMQEEKENFKVYIDQIYVE